MGLCSWLIVPPSTMTWKALDRDVWRVVTQLAGASTGSDHGRRDLAGLKGKLRVV
jgi:hypothetical protein